MRRVIVIALLGLPLTGCGSNPAAPAAPACQANHTASATFQNVSNVALDVIFDGGYIGSLSPGQSMQRTVSAGTSHPVTWRITNTNLFPCSTQLVNVADCATDTYASCQ